MAKILSVLTLIFALGATFLSFKSKDLVETLKASAEKEHGDLDASRKEVKTTKEKLKTSEDDLVQSKAELEKSKDSQKTAEAEAAKAKGDLTAATTELEQTKTKLADLETKIKTMTPDGGGGDLKAQIEAMQAKSAELEVKVKTLENEKAELTTTVETLSSQRKELDDRIAKQGSVINRYQKNVMAKGTHGRVLAVNAGWGFCVLSIGDRQGAAANKVMVVVRDGYSIGRVKIINVESSQSVADIIPSSFARGTYVQPGDDVIFTGDDKVREEQPTGTTTATAPASSPALPALPQP
jgi:hypothetical protein